ncbi:PAS domain-containing protein [Hyphococcus flavus]|uniref:PAS domain-containing protein n=1 Tax=Hyphococcus flavus TaxID=1866326 RepID=A0AAE9ZFN7_9PROT|nr:PAS domain-containing protein [Hyphococcus flavus]WDI32975.1 PAS domain-containing protein [Hyphococcus flavus]
MTPAKTRESKLNVIVNDEEMEAIDDWRFKHRLPSRAAAIRELIGRGMSVDSPEVDTSIVQSTKNIGVLASALTRATNECFVITNPHMYDNPILYASPGFYKTTGYTEKEVIGRNCRFLQGAETDRSTVSDIRNNLNDERIVDTQILNYHKDGTPIRFQLHIEPVVNPDTAELLFFIGRQFKID